MFDSLHSEPRNEKCTYAVLEEKGLLTHTAASQKYRYKSVYIFNTNRLQRTQHTAHDLTEMIGIDFGCVILYHFSDVRSVQVGEGQSGAPTFDENIFKTSVLTGSSETMWSEPRVQQPVQKSEGVFYWTRRT